MAQAPKKKAAAKRSATSAPQTTEEIHVENDGMTLAEVARLVKREIPVLKEGKPTGDTRQVAIRPDEILDYAEYSDHVVVVTTDGRKIRGDK